MNAFIRDAMTLPFAMLLDDCMCLVYLRSVDNVSDIFLLIIAIIHKPRQGDLCKYFMQVIFAQLCWHPIVGDERLCVIMFCLSLLQHQIRSKRIIGRQVWYAERHCKIMTLQNCYNFEFH